VNAVRLDTCFTRLVGGLELKRESVCSFNLEGTRRACWAKRSWETGNLSIWQARIQQAWSSRVQARKGEPNGDGEAKAEALS
jgi:hypothetical protein